MKEAALAKARAQNQSREKERAISKVRQQVKSIGEMEVAMRIFIGLLGFLLGIIFISGCGNLTSIYRPLEVDKGKGALIDIKQRAIFVSRQAKRITTENGNVTEIIQPIVCAEPSPDSMSAYAAELDAKAPLPEQGSTELTSAI